jgi:branched-chain amino acid transport system ATP-binding protein
VTALLRVEGLCRRFGGLMAVDDVSFAVEPGTCVGVIGPNGAGKSTLVNLVTGHLRPSSGRVEVDGQDVTGAPPWSMARLGVSRTFQVGKPFRDMTVCQNVAVGAMFGSGGSPSVPAAETRAREVLERVGLGGRADALPGELPVADMRRLELARALAMGPRLLLVDEVMAGLRPAEVDAAVQLIRSLKGDGVTVVAVEHVMKAIMGMCDHVVVLHEGKILCEGPPQEIATDERVIVAYLGERYAKRMQEADDARG